MTKKILFLDLDQTIISSELCNTFDFKKDKEKVLKYIMHNMENYYLIFERPNLQDFLDYIFKNFYVCVWTAASKDYAFFIIQNIILAGKPERKINYLFFEEHCDISEKLTNRTKNLEILYKHFKIKKFKNIKNIFILDDNDEVFETQPKNCIKAKPFEYNDQDSHKDFFLKKLKDKLINIKKLDTRELNNQLENI